ncbi:hypothetical protein HX021_08445 [Sphingobacterium sp. N143]|uniref:hypothetical protein n=1 Tax=Sphingobacterium sp. N143 TaxID=2746727 RepID=UPI002575F91A|nr:hypothetical protein [Sphingobacterium sp. N143]MDM1294327.1 hypothetical protein [Sphingobacterium sp. N143]
MKLFELQKGQLFNFVGPKRAKVYMVRDIDSNTINYCNVSDSQDKHIKSIRNNARLNVEVVESVTRATLTNEEVELLKSILLEANNNSYEEKDSDRKRTVINGIWLKIK